MWLALLTITLLAGCSESPTDAEPEAGTEITNTISTQLPVDNGEVGIVVDVRDIFRRGYKPVTVDIAFPDHAALGQTLDLDPITGLAVLRIHNDSLSQAQKDAFASGVDVEITVPDPVGGEVLATHSEAALVIDDSGVPLRVLTTRPRLFEPLDLQEGVPYLLQPESEDGLLFVGPAFGAEVRSDSAGAAFGTLSELRCPPGFVGVGHSIIRPDPNWPGQLRLVCRHPVSGELSDFSETTDSIAGWIPPAPGDSECPENGGSPTYLVHDSVGVQPHDAADPYSPFVRSVHGFCYSLEQIVRGSANAAASLSAGALGYAAPPTNDLFCPDGSVVTGLRGRIHYDPHGSYLVPHLRQIGYVCQEVVPLHNVGAYVPNTPEQQFFFTPVGAGPNTFLVQTAWGYWAESSGEVGLTPLDTDADAFVLDQDDDGWARLRLQGTADHVVRNSDGTLGLSSTTASRFRLITDDITWEVADRGLTYHQPITPPARLDFAYQATIRNCSPATYTETIGKNDKRTRTVTASTTESVQIFSQHQVGGTFTVGAARNPKVGGVGWSVSISGHYDYTRSDTRTTGSTWSQETSEEIEVSRTRTLEIPPFTGVEAYDAVRTIRNVRIPFTHVVRFTGQYGDGTALAGSEILTQMVFNFVEGVPTAVGPDYVDIGVRGNVIADQLLQAESQVVEIPNACG